MLKSLLENGVVWLVFHILDMEDPLYWEEKKKGCVILTDCMYISLDLVSLKSRREVGLLCKFRGSIASIILLISGGY